MLAGADVESLTLAGAFILGALAGTVATIAVARTLITATVAVARTLVRERRRPE